LSKPRHRQAHQAFCRLSNSAHNFLRSCFILPPHCFITQHPSLHNELSRTARARNMSQHVVTSKSPSCLVKQSKSTLPVGYHTVSILQQESGLACQAISRPVYNKCNVFKCFSSRHGIDCQARGPSRTAQRDRSSNWKGPDV
jgi:hypothetical protein